jgi:tetratricopeptide (TPR) repeat protein
MNNAKRAFNDFISEDPQSANNQLLRKLLLKRIQQQPDIYWYELLSWLYVQEGQYNKSFVQEKAIYKRFPDSLDRLFELALFALEDGDTETAERVFNYILESSQVPEIRLTAHQYLLELRATNAEEQELQRIDKDYKALFDRYGLFEPTLSLQLAYGDFLAFYLNKSEEASSFLKRSLELQLSPYQQGLVKLKLGDILVLQEKFNEALIYFTQIQANLKNSTLSQEARFKVAKTSYYKGDFDWAETQLKILKSSSSQLIANDALDLKLIISDNKYEDSTRTALKLYAKADLLDYQNKTGEAILTLDRILEEHKGESIIDEALYRQAKLYEKQLNYEAAVTNYLRITRDYPEDILIDDAYFYLAEIYRTQLDQPEEAKTYYEKIIFEHEDSIYFVEARTQYRRLRGDAIE